MSDLDQPTRSPVVLNQPLMVACGFLFINDTNCANISLYDGKVAYRTIPNEIGLLTELTYLDLSAESLTGTIPSTLGNLTRLTYLDLAVQDLNGTIPSTLGNLEQITYLGLNLNQLTGTIPSVLINLDRLIYLGLSENQLTGTIPSVLGNLVNLTYLYLYDNQLNGTVPSEMENLIQLDYLYFNNNPQLTGTIPSALCSVSSGMNIVIDCGSLVCSCCNASFEVGGASCPVLPPPSPTTAALTANQTTNPTTSPLATVGTPSETTNTPVAINPVAAAQTIDQQLIVVCNFLLYSNLTACQSLTRFEGGTMGNTIPSEIGLLNQLTHLDLNLEGLTGTIPSTIGSLVQLTYLGIDDNQLVGTIPSSLGNLIGLTYLYLYKNQLSGTIPSTLGSLVQLDYFYLYSNPQLGGTIAPSLCSVSPAVFIFLDCDKIECSCCQSYDDETFVTANCTL